MSPSEDALLEAIRVGGWNPRRQQIFLQRYGKVLRRALLVELGRRLGRSTLASLAEHVKALQTGCPASGPVAGRLLDLARDIWQDVCVELFSEGENTIMKYFRHNQERRARGQKPLSFEAYLMGLVRFKLLQNLRRQPPEFVSLEALSPRQMLELEEDVEGAVWEDRLAAQAQELAPADAADLYWEGLLQCGMPEPQELERKLLLRERKEHLLCWACCALKGKLRGRRRENLLAFIAFFVSQRGAQRPREPLPRRHELSLATLTGRYLRWEEDICRIFEKAMRKDRVLAQIREELLRSPYRDLVQGGEG